ncbi:MAG: hypothetical protein ACJATA_000961 [Sphingobacteriales bacterium]|jgi:hypothetical protein
MKKKIELKDLKVKSFITAIENEAKATVKGGISMPHPVCGSANHTYLVCHSSYCGSNNPANC